MTHITFINVYSMLLEELEILLNAIKSAIRAPEKKTYVIAGIVADELKKHYKVELVKNVIIIENTGLEIIVEKTPLGLEFIIVYDEDLDIAD